MFEVYAARGEDLMHYDLHGELRNTVGQETRLTQLSYRRWNVSLTDFDALLEKGVLEPSTWELLAGVLRASLPSDVLLRQPHLLRKQKQEWSTCHVVRRIHECKCSFKVHVEVEGPFV